MEFTYDSVFGLNYTSPGTTIIIDIECLPKDVDLKEIFKLVNYTNLKFDMELFGAKSVIDQNIYSNYE